MHPGAENHRFAIPRDVNLITDWCADPSETISDESAASGYADSLPIPTLQCSQMPAYFEQNFSAPCNGQVPSSGGCLWNN